MSARDYMLSRLVCVRGTDTPELAARALDAYRAEVRAETLCEAAKQVDLLAEYYEGEADIPTELNKNAVRVMRMVAQRIELMAAWPDVEEEK